MAASNTCWGIEIGAFAIKALKLQAEGENVRILDFVVLPHKKVLSSPDTDPNDVLRVSLGAFTSQYDLTGASIAISVPGHAAFARFAKLPPVEPKKVPDIVKFEAVQQIPFPIDQVEWDYQTFVSPDSPEVEVGIFAITRERIMERLGLYQELRLTPDYVTLSPVAAYNALAFDLEFTEKTPGTIVLDIGTTSTDLIVAEAGRVWIRTFPIGGHHFTEALVNEFKVTYPRAEKHKREAETSKHARHIFQAMRPVFADLAQDVQRSIGYYQSLHKDAKLTRLIGLGSTFRLPGLRKYLKQQIQMDVYRMEQFKRLSLDGPRAGEFTTATLNMGTAYGLALQGLGMAALEANLMPTAVLRRAMWERKVKWFGVAAGVAAAAGLAMFIRPFWDSTAVSSVQRPAVISEVISKSRDLKKHVEELGGADADYAAADMMSLLDSRGVYAHIVDDVGLMLESAQKASESWPEGGGAKVAGQAYTVRDLRTTYAFGDDSGAPRPDRGEGESTAAKPLPTVKVVMTVSTTQPDAQKFIVRTIDAWLRSNAKRPGVPYEIRVGRDASKKLGEVTAAAPAPGGEAGAPRRPTAQQPGSRAPGGRRGREVEERRQQREDEELGQAMGEGGAAPDPGAQAAAEAARKAADDLKRAAPLPGEPPAPPGVTVTTFEVSWECVVTPEAAPAAGGGAS